MVVPIVSLVTSILGASWYFPTWTYIVTSSNFSLTSQLLKQEPQHKLSLFLYVCNNKSWRQWRPKHWSNRVTTNFHRSSQYHHYEIGIHLNQLRIIQGHCPHPSLLSLSFLFYSGILTGGATVIQVGMTYVYIYLLDNYGMRTTLQFAGAVSFTICLSAAVTYLPTNYSTEDVKCVGEKSIFQRYISVFRNKKYLIFLLVIIVDYFAFAVSGFHQVCSNCSYSPGGGWSGALLILKILASF